MGNLATPKRVQKLQTALHAKAKAEAGYRFYALYDKISRDDILAHAYAQCRSNKGAPGIDGQDFADIEAYGVERWLAELALALRQETYHGRRHHPAMRTTGARKHAPWRVGATLGPAQTKCKQKGSARKSADPQPTQFCVGYTIRVIRT